MWGLGALTAVLIGITVAVAFSPVLERAGMRRDWALTTAFVAGLLGTIPVALGLLTGVATIAAGALLMCFAIRHARLLTSDPHWAVPA